MRNKQSGCPRRRERAHGAGEGETETPVAEVVWRVGAEPGCFLGGRGLGNGSLVTSSVTSERKMSTRRGEAELEDGEEGRKRRNARGGQVGTRKTRGNGQRPVENFSQSGEQWSNAKPGRAVVRWTRSASEWLYQCWFERRGFSTVGSFVHLPCSSMLPRSSLFSPGFSRSLRSRHISSKRPTNVVPTASQRHPTSSRVLQTASKRPTNVVRRSLDVIRLSLASSVFLPPSPFPSLPFPPSHSSGFVVFTPFIVYPHRKSRNHCIQQTTVSPIQCFYQSTAFPNPLLFHCFPPPDSTNL